jgi:hypothetical protein
MKRVNLFEAQTWKKKKKKSTLTAHRARLSFSAAIFPTTCASRYDCPAA